MNTIEDTFDRFIVFLEMGDISEAILVERERIESIISRKWDVVQCFVTGEYVRGTLIPPLSQAHIELMVALDIKYIDTFSPRSLLDSLRDVLGGKLTRDSTGITIKGESFYIDVIPAFKAGKRCVIPHYVRGENLPVDLLIYPNIWKDDNERQEGKLIPLMKMIKYFARAYRLNLTAFHIECLVRQAAMYYRIRDYPKALLHTFEEMIDSIQTEVVDPAGLHFLVGNCASQEDLDRAEEKIRYARMQMKVAESYLKGHNTKEAMECIGSVLGIDLNSRAMLNLST